MRKISIVFAVLLIIFAGTWIIKMKAPKNRPDSYANGFIEGNYWWDTVEEPETVDMNWQLQVGIPENYIPVPGSRGLYMVVDEEGYIIGYKRGEKHEDGSWDWKDTNPDIPENYEAVPGLENVYKATSEDGTVSYFRYVRNKDDTYAFVEVDAKGNVIGEKMQDGAKVPENYERVSGNQYAVKNQNGVTIGYKERVIDNGSESGFAWININESDIQDMSLPDVGFNLTKDTTGEGDITGGIREHAGFIADRDLSAAVPTLMPQGDMNGEENGNFVFYTQPTSYTVTEEYLVTMPPSGNIVIAGGNDIQNPEQVIREIDYSGAESSFVIEGLNNNLAKENTVPSGIGTYVSTEVTTSTRQEGNYIVSYATTIEKTYDLSGNLLGTKSGTPQEISRKKATVSAVYENAAVTLDEEYGRMYNAMTSAAAGFNSCIANQMVNLLNNDRGAAGIGYVNFNGNSKAYKIALCRAIMMALTGSNNRNMQTYGTLGNMCGKYGVSSGSPSENMFITTSGTSAEAIHNALQNSTSREARMAGNYTEIAVAVVERSGRMYIDEVFLN